MQKKIAIEDATEEQLRTFASETLGISISPTAKLPAVRAKIRAAWDKAEILVEAGEETPEAPSPEDKPKAKKAKAHDGEKMVTVHIGVTQGKDGKEAVPVGVNGKVMLIPRGKNVEIPISYYQVLQNAIRQEYDTDEDGNIIPEPREVMQYPVQLVA